MHNVGSPSDLDLYMLCKHKKPFSEYDFNFAKHYKIKTLQRFP